MVLINILQIDKVVIMFCNDFVQEVIDYLNFYCEDCAHFWNTPIFYVCVLILCLGVILGVCVGHNLQKGHSNE